MKNLSEIRSAINSSFKKLLRPISEPLGNFLLPVTNKWESLTAPIRQSWQTYAQKHPREAKILSWGYMLTKWGVIFVFLIILMTLFGVFGKLPSTEDLKDIENANASEVYSMDNILIGKYYTENRTTIKLDSISPYLITALLAIEDKRFFEHSGIDLRSWMRVFKGVATNTQNLGGGSTLSQQLAKNLYPRRNYKVPGLSIFINKVRENIISIKLEKLHNKEELLIMYLNTVSFGGNRFGIKEASRYFYNKHPKQLTADQAATLIGMLKATTALDPTRNPKNSEKRRNLVLSQMVKNKDFRFESEEMATISHMINTGNINENQYADLIKKPIDAAIHDDIGNNEGLGAYFREYLRTKELPRILKNLLKEDGSNWNINTDGLKIYTTLDSRMQNHAENAVFKQMSYLQKEFYNHWKGYKEEKPWGDDKWIDEQVKRSERFQLLVKAGYNQKDIDSIFKIPVPMKVFSWAKVPIERDTMMAPIDSVRYYFTMLNCGFMAMEHENGYVKAWVGGTDFKYFKYDHILSKRQVGSTFKPVVYAAALNDSIKPCDYFRNKEITIEDWSPKNSDNEYGGWYTMIGGLTYSSNVIAAQLIEKVGIQKTLDLAKKMGITSTLPREFGISLGAADISLYEMMKVYGSIANKGVRPEIVTVLKIKDRYGNVIYDYNELVESDPTVGPHVRALDTLIASTMTRMLQSVVVYGTANTLRSQYCRHCDFAAKTGTTQNQSDGWLISYNPKLVTGAWVGGPSPAVRFRTMSLGRGAAMALPIVGNFWYSLSIDPKSAQITQNKFSFSQKVSSATACPFRIGISPDTLYLLMQDTVWRDSITRSGYKNLKKLVEDVYGTSVEDVPEGDGEGNPAERQIILQEVGRLDAKKQDLQKSPVPNILENKKNIDPKEKSKDPPKKGGGRL